MMTDTRARILDLAEGLTQAKGFNGFSYLDLAAQIGVKNSSIHYHFKAKADLALALVERHDKDLREGCAQMDQQLPQPEQRIAALIEHFEGYVREQKICMCGMMAAELETVSLDVRKALIVYFHSLRSWLTDQFKQMDQSDPDQTALMFLSALEGAVLLARLEGDPTLVSRALNGFVNS